VLACSAVVASCQEFDFVGHRLHSLALGYMYSGLERAASADKDSPPFMKET